MHFVPVGPRFFPAAVALWAVFLLGGCASMTRDGSSQTTLIRTNPPGATIYLNGKAVGRTPELVEISRGYSPTIELATTGGKKEFELETRYRWGPSFGRNLVFLTYAPIAWLIDLMTGTAWDIRDSDPIPVSLSKADQETPKLVHEPPQSVVAPPRSSSVAMSDDGGRALERSLRETFRAKPGVGTVRSYDVTLPVFIEHDYEFGTSDVSAKRRLFKALDADYVYESFAEPDEDGWVLKSEVVEVRGTNRNKGPTLRLGRDTQGPRLLGVGFGLQPWWSRILPDTVGVDFVDEKVKLDVLGATYELKPVYGDEWWATGLRYISAINISSTPDRRREFLSRWEFSAVPSLSLSRKLVKIAGLPAMPGQFVESEPEFERWRVAGGYGLEVGYLFGRHYVYFDLIPVFNWSQISWRQNGQNRQATRTGITGRTEIGYTYVFDSNWLMRIFSRSQGESNELWQDVVATRLGSSYAPTAAQAVVSGLTLGYRFDSDRFQATNVSGK